MEVDAEDVAGLYRRFAAIEARGSSPTYERLCLAVAEHPGVLALLAGLPRGKRQPNLLLGALRLLDADVSDPDAALRLATDRAEDVRAIVLSHATQTNEPARCAVLLPALATLPEPLALLEVGASAGLCLRYDAYRYRYRADTGAAEVTVGDGDVVLDCTVTDVPLPARVPVLAARLGLDAHPLDPTDAGTAQWLRCLVWPEHTDRAGRLDAALRAAAADPPTVLTGLAPDDVAGAVARLREAAPDATPVVVHSATAAYLSPEQRATFAVLCRDLGVHRVGLEGSQVSADLGVPAPPDLPGRFLLTLDDAVLGDAHPHGRDLVWHRRV